MRKQVKWSDEYRGVLYEVTFWGEGIMNDGAGMWNYYIVVREPQLSSEDWQKVWLEPVRWMNRSGVENEPIYSEEDSVLAHGGFHGGITFYEKVQAVETDPPKRLIRVGCDYGHLFDRERGYPYNLDSVSRDARKTIDNLCEFLTFKRRCCWSGHFFFEEEGIYDPDSDSILSPEGWKSKNQLRKEREI